MPDWGNLATAGAVGFGIGLGLMAGAYAVRLLRAVMRGGGSDDA